MTRRTSRSLGWTGWTAARRFPRPVRARLSTLASLWKDDEHQSTHGRRPPGSRVHGLKGGEEEEPDLGKARQRANAKEDEAGAFAPLPVSPRRLLELRLERRFHAGSPQQQKVLQGREVLAWCKGEVKQEEEEVKAEEEEEEKGEAGPPPPPTRWGMGRGRCRCGGTSGQR